MKTTIALIVTHNNYSSLVKCINLVRNQTIKPDDILVVNNGSSDYTSVWLDQQNDINHIYQDNLGTAGGFFTGIDFAYTNGYENVWCMNDDSFPALNALEIMLKEKTQEPLLLQSNLMNKETKQSLFFQNNDKINDNDDFQGFVVDSNKSLNGTLISRSIINMVGLPKAKLYAHGDATEYISRIVNKFSIPSKIMLNSKHYQPATLSYKQEWELSSNWGYYFYIRNQREVLLNEFHYSVMQMSAYLFFILTAIWHIIRYQKKDQLKKFNLLIKAFSHSILNKHTYTPVCIQGFINKQYKHTTLGIFARSVQDFFLTIFVPSHSLVLET